MGAIPEVKMRQKTQTRQVYNEELGRYEWKEVETEKSPSNEEQGVYHNRTALNKNR